jgi:hypothetical protein
MYFRKQSGEQSKKVNNKLSLNVFAKLLQVHAARFLRHKTLNMDVPMEQAKCLYAMDKKPILFAA